MQARAKAAGVRYGGTRAQLAEWLRNPDAAPKARKKAQLGGDGNGAAEGEGANSKYKREEVRRVGDEYDDMTLEDMQAKAKTVGIRYGATRAKLAEWLRNPDAAPKARKEPTISGGATTALLDNNAKIEVVDAVAAPADSAIGSSSTPAATVTPVMPAAPIPLPAPIPQPIPLLSPSAPPPLLPSSHPAMLPVMPNMGTYPNVPAISPAAPAPVLQPSPIVPPVMPAAIPPVMPAPIMPPMGGVTMPQFNPLPSMTTDAP